MSQKQKKKKKKNKDLTNFAFPRHLFSSSGDRHQRGQILQSSEEDALGIQLFHHEVRNGHDRLVCESASLETGQRYRQVLSNK